MDSVVSGLQYKALTIPCKPSSPNIEVKLYRGTDEAEVNYIFVNSKYNHFRAFIC